MQQQNTILQSNSSVTVTTSPELTDVRYQDAICLNESKLKHPLWYNLKYTLLGMLFGFILIKAEVISWFRIQEMFYLKSFHMYGLIGSAVFTGLISLQLLKLFRAKTIYGERIKTSPKTFNKGQIFGGLLFGLGWAMTGACPGPIYAQIGTGATAAAVVLFFAILGTWTYGRLRDKLPH
jgi:uncharacterized membrane protein YedE/YeeE